MNTAIESLEDFQDQSVTPPEVTSSVDRSNEIVRVFCTLCGTVCKTMGDIDNHPTKTSCPVNASLKLLLDSNHNHYVTFTCKTCGDAFVDLSAYPSHKRNGPIPSRLSIPVSSSPMATGKHRISVIPDSNNAPNIIPHASTCMHCKKNFYNRVYCKSCQQVFSTQVEEDEHGNSCLYDAGVAPLDEKTVSTCNVDGCVLQFVTTSSPDKGLALHRKNAHDFNPPSMPSPKSRPMQPKKTGTAIYPTAMRDSASAQTADMNEAFLCNGPRPANPLDRKGPKGASSSTMIHVATQKEIPCGQNDTEETEPIFTNGEALLSRSRSSQEIMEETLRVNDCWLFCALCGAGVEGMADTESHLNKTSFPYGARQKPLDETHHVTFICRICKD